VSGTLDGCAPWRAGLFARGPRCRKRETAYAFRQASSGL